MNILSIRRLSAIVAAFVLAFVSFTSAHAETLRHIATVNVPFAFEYGSHQFAAGRYTISRVNDKVISISNGTATGIALTLPSHDKNEARTSNVVFHKVGGQYFLREIYTAGNPVHAECWQSKAEAQAMKTQLALNQAPRENVEVVTLESLF